MIEDADHPLREERFRFEIGAAPIEILLLAVFVAHGGVFVSNAMPSKASRTHPRA